MKCGDCRYTKPCGNGLVRCVPAWLDACENEARLHPWLSRIAVEDRVSLRGRAAWEECDRTAKCDDRDDWQQVADHRDDYVKFSFALNPRPLPPTIGPFDVFGRMISESTPPRDWVLIPGQAETSIDDTAPDGRTGHAAAAEPEPPVKSRDVFLFDVGDRVVWWEPGDKTHGDTGRVVSGITHEDDSQDLTVRWDSDGEETDCCPGRDTVDGCGVVLPADWDRREAERLQRLGVGVLY